MFLRRLFVRIPKYGQLVHKPKPWFRRTDEDTKMYDSLMLYGIKRHKKHKERLYLVLTEAAIADAEEKAAKYVSQIKVPILFGVYTGKTVLNSVKHGGCVPKTCELIFLRVFRYKEHGRISDSLIALTERHFKRAHERAKMHPEYIVKHKWWHPIIEWLYGMEERVIRALNKKAK